MRRGGGALAFWPWRQALRSLELDPDAVLGGAVESPEDRLRVFDAVAETLGERAEPGGLVVILDDLHWADEPSLRLLRHLADRLEGASLLVLGTFRDVEPGGALPRVLPDLLRAPAFDRLDLGGFDLAEVREQLERVAGESAADARAVLDLTGGNPLFVREIARAVADGTWRPDWPPATVLEVVTARLGRVGPDCRRLVQAAAIVGRDVDLPLVAAAIGRPVRGCLPLLDEAIAHGLLDRVGALGEHRFVHALTRDAVEASLSSLERADLHRRVAAAIEARFGGDLSEHLMDLARHWTALAPYGEATTARGWTVRAAADAVRRLAYEGVRLYRAALTLEPATLPADERARLQVALGRAAYFAGDVAGCAEVATAAADAARAAASPRLLAEAALVLEAVPDPVVNAVTSRLCDGALAALGDTGDEALRARLLAQRSHLAFYDGEQERLEPLSTAALALARGSRDDRALIEALRARQEACPGPTGRAERLSLAAEMLAVSERVGSPRAAMWGGLWRIEALIESGLLTAAVDALGSLRVAVERVGGPVSTWHLDRVTACVAQAQGRYADAVEAAGRGFARMRVVEPGPATGAFIALNCALSAHVGVRPEVAGFIERPVVPLPRFRTVGPLSRAFHLACTLLRRNAAGDRAAAQAAAAAAASGVRRLGMTAYAEPDAALGARSAGSARPSLLSPREAEVAALVADGLTNRQIADRLVISERAAQNHVQHILTKLGFATRSQIAAWSARQE